MTSDIRSVGHEINQAIGKAYGRNLWDYEVRWSEAGDGPALYCTSCNGLICDVEADDSLFALVATALDHRPGHDCEEDILP